MKLLSFIILPCVILIFVSRRNAFAFDCQSVDGVEDRCSCTYVSEEVEKFDLKNSLYLDRVNQSFYRYKMTCHDVYFEVKNHTHSIDLIYHFTLDRNPSVI